MSLETQLDQWMEAALIDSTTAEKILQFEQTGGSRKLRWPVVVAITFGVLMLCAGVLLFVAAHWDQLSPTQRLLLVLSMVASFHVAGAVSGTKVPSLAIALHAAGTVALGAGIFLAGQIFNLAAHWPAGLLLWALGAALAWLILRQWPQAAFAALLIPWWLAGEWDVATSHFSGAWSIAAQGLLLLAIFYLTTPYKQAGKHLRLALIWIGGFSVIPLVGDVIATADSSHWWFWRGPSLPLPLSMVVLGYSVAYLPILLLTFITRKKGALWMLSAALWVAILAVLSGEPHFYDQPWLYLWATAGAFALCLWGVRENRRLLINYGTAIFAITLIGFYFSQVLDKLGRSVGLITLGVLFLGGGWLLHRLRTGLIAHAAATTGGNL